MSNYIDIQVGDKVRLTYEGIVEASFPSTGYLKLADSYVIHSSHETTKVERLSLPKPKVGDIVTGRQVNSIKWKRGSILGGKNDHKWVLLGNGRWCSLSDGSTYQFSDFYFSNKYAVKYVA